MEVFKIIKMSEQTTDLLKIYGVTTELFSFLYPLEVLKFQVLNQWMYTHGVSRVQFYWER